MSERGYPETSMSIHELAARSGVPERRIRYYIAEGLLSPPRGRGRAAHYGPEHLERLAEIQALRSQHLGLEEIRQRLQRHTDSARSPADGSLWRHWELKPGVLLIARADLVEPEMQRVEALASMARQLLGDAGREGERRGDRRSAR
ncbi:helix-turn-helix domain-containing protein [Thermomicrobiaceae bacterium CFH 74404]|uniref:Helix-turn-helix domain-containing protein n=3 Tax=Thermomicrobia TaxID=189775 RepID=A0AA41WE30_9BACT|nr:helix-turn-helix domain-containing protein [Thermalbibacter longus]MCM8748869.1 helix-turn-helix domain-containing protein [Thermalbibacter longus]